MEIGCATTVAAAVFTIETLISAHRLAGPGLRTLETTTATRATRSGQTWVLHLQVNHSSASVPL